MIAYDLRCTNGHTFEGWFDCGQAFEDQQEKGLVTCPVCNDASVSKIPSTFAIKGTSPQKEPPNPEIIAKKVAEFVDKNFDNVGCDFAKEALKIHYGSAEPRNIRGVSSEEEEKTLKKEGIDFFKIPLPSPPDTDS